MPSSESLSRLREAIIADVAEDMSMIGEMTEWHEELVAAWNAVAASSPTVGIPAPITDSDLDDQFEG